MWLTRIHSYHPSLQILQHPPHAINVLGERIAGQPHARVICQLDRLLLRLELVQRGDGRERLLARDQHLLLHVRDDGRLEEVSPFILDLVPAQDDLRSQPFRVLDLVGGLRDPPRRRQRPHGRPLRRAVAHDDLARPLLQHLRELVVDARLHVDPVRGDARLARVAPLQRHELVQRLVEVGVVEDDKRAVAAQFQGDLFQALGAVRGDEFPDAGRPREGNLLDEWMLAERLAQRRRVVQIRRQHVEHARREPCLLGQVHQGQRRDGRLRAGLDYHRAAGGQRSARLAQDHRHREIPGHQGGRDADGLLHSEDAPAGNRGDGNPAVNALRLAGKPPGEAGGVVDLAVCLREGLPRLVGEELGEVVPVLADEGVPFQEPLGALAGGDLFVFLKRGMGGLDGSGDIFGGVGRAAGPDDAGAGVCWVNSMRGNLYDSELTKDLESTPFGRLDPFVVDEGIEVQ